MLQADQAVANAQAQLDSLLEGPDLSAAQSSVSAAAARLQGSEANYTLNIGGPTAAQIAAAEAQLAQAQASLADLQDGVSAEQIAIADAELAQARLSLQEAEEALADAAITAPFAGVVTAVNVSPGEIASGPIVRLVDNSTLKVLLEVDEVDIAGLRPGQPATITLETWPEIEIPSAISVIAPSAQTAPGSSLVTYEVHLPLGSTNLPVRLGMTANANLITAEVTDALLVPNRAINVDRETGVYSVQLMQGEEIVEQPVQVGLRDSQYTVINDGLQEGDELLIGANIPRQVFGPPTEEN
jgi:HlyD family secretion protein